MNFEIGRINVIVGKNTTGKSTLAKFLFSLLTAAYSEGTQLANNDIHSKLLNFVIYWKSKGPQEMEEKFKQIRNSLKHNSEKYEDIYDNVVFTLENYDFKDKELCINDLNDLFRIIKLNKDEYFRYRTVFNSLIESEYGSSLNKFSDTHIKFHGTNEDFVFNKDGENFSMQNTASGLKQLAIIQLLLDNNELTNNSFLILDVPEINLHPSFQVEFAKILVLAARDLNIVLYINTHSPFFAEAIEAYSRYYDLMDDTNFYLTEKIDGGDKYNFNLFDSDEILDVYDDLGNPFDIIHIIKIKADLRD